MGPTAHVSAAKGVGERNDADTNGSDTSSDEDDGGCFILSQEPHGGMDGGRMGTPSIRTTLCTLFIRDHEMARSSYRIRSIVLVTH